MPSSPKKMLSVPPFLLLPAAKKKEKLIRKYSEQYLRGVQESGEVLGPATQYIPGYIEALTEHHKDFELITPEMIKTTYKFIESIRGELKNKIEKINKELKDA